MGQSQNPTLFVPRRVGCQLANVTASLWLTMLPLRCRCLWQWHERRAPWPSPRIEAVDGVAQLALDAPLPLRRQDFSALHLPDIKCVDCRSLFGANPGGGNVQAELA